MNKREFIKLIERMKHVVHDKELEWYLRDLKNHFDEDTVTRIEDYLFLLDDKTLLMTTEQFYNYIQSK